MPPRAEPVLAGAVVALGAVQGELDFRFGRNRDLDLASSVSLGDTGFNERGDSGAPFLVGGDLAGQGVVERPTGGAYVAGEVLALGQWWGRGRTGTPGTARRRSLSLPHRRVAGHLGRHAMTGHRQRRSGRG